MGRFARTGEGVGAGVGVDCWAGFLIAQTRGGDGSTPSAVGPTDPFFHSNSLRPSLIIHHPLFLLQLVFDLADFFLDVGGAGGDGEAFLEHTDAEDEEEEGGLRDRREGGARWSAGGHGRGLGVGGDVKVVDRGGGSGTIIRREIGGRKRKKQYSRGV